MMDTQTDRQADKKFNVLATPVGESELSQTRPGDRGPRARSCTYKTFGGVI